MTSIVNRNPEEKNIYSYDTQASDTRYKEVTEWASSSFDLSSHPLCELQNTKIFMNSYSFFRDSPLSIPMAISANGELKNLDCCEHTDHPLCGVSENLQDHY